MIHHFKILSLAQPSHNVWMNFQDRTDQKTHSGHQVEHTCGDVERPPRDVEKT